MRGTNLRNEKEVNGAFSTNRLGIGQRFFCGSRNVNPPPFFFWRTARQKFYDFIEHFLKPPFNPNNSEARVSHYLSKNGANHWVCPKSPGKKKLQLTVCFTKARIGIVASAADIAIFSNLRR